MYELDHMLNGKGSQQHHQDIIRWAQDEKLTREVEEAQRSQKTGVIHPGIASHLLAAPLNLMTALLTILRRTPASQTLPRRYRLMNRILPR